MRLNNQGAQHKHRHDGDQTEEQGRRISHSRTSASRSAARPTAAPAGPGSAAAPALSTSRSTREMMRPALVAVEIAHAQRLDMGEDRRRADALSTRMAALPAQILRHAARARSARPRSRQAQRRPTAHRTIHAGVAGMHEPRSITRLISRAARRPSPASASRSYGGGDRDPRTGRSSGSSRAEACRGSAVCWPASLRFRYRTGHCVVRVLRRHRSSPISAR